MDKVNENIFEETPVLIIGGGISGLSAALFHLRQGVKPLLIERHKTTSIHPRARGFDVRTMELYRELHLSGAIREAGKALAPAWGIHSASSMAALLKNKKAKKKITSPVQIKGLQLLADQSPEISSRCTQDLSEPVLLASARGQDADIRFYTELVSFRQDETGITATIQDRASGCQSTIKAQYMIAADGAKSNIRETLNIPTVGAGVLGDLLNIYFEADLKKYVEGREFSILNIYEPGIKGMLTSINNSDRWVFHLSYEPAKGEGPGDFTHEQVTSILQRVIGYPDVAIRIISILPWQPTVKVVTQMRQGRIFLAGDAAHVMPPYGGKGANTGVQDVHNLAWKLALVLKNKASEKLLDTYSKERQPVGWHNADNAGKWANEYGLINTKNKKMIFAFLSVMVAGFLKLNWLFPRLPMKKLGELMGFPNMKYPLPGEQTTAYHKVEVLNGQPGTRFPHIWAVINGNKISVLDLLGKDFVLFTGKNNKDWQDAAVSVSNRFGLSIPVYSIGEDGDLVSDISLKKVMGIASSGAILVRPDGFVTQRFCALPTEPVPALAAALSSALSI